MFVQGSCLKQEKTHSPRNSINEEKYNQFFTIMTLNGHERVEKFNINSVEDVTAIKEINANRS